MVVKPKSKKWINMNTIKNAFSSGLGIFGAQAAYMIVGLLFFIPGYMFRESPFGIACMFIGVCIMGGPGLMQLLESL